MSGLHSRPTTDPGSNHIHTFLLCGPTLHEVPRALSADVGRKRATTGKSRNACLDCKRRRVKCDELYPSCTNCTRRAKPCRRDVSQAPSAHHPVPRDPVKSPVPGIQRREHDTGVDLLHLQLFHHFQTQTLPTLILPPAVWHSAIQLSFQFGFLANAILCISARHLAFLNPRNATYEAAAARHLSLCLSQFHQCLSGDLASLEIDAFIATSLLLQYEIWTETDICRPQEDREGVYDPSKDRIFAFTSSLKRVFLDTLPRWPGDLDDSEFLPFLAQDPNPPLLEASELLETTRAAYKSALRNTDECTRKDSTVEPQPDGLGVATGQVCLFNAPALQTRLQQDESPERPLLASLLRSMVGFPTQCRGDFASRVQRGDSQALAVLCHFYRAVRTLLPREQSWWSAKRANIAEKGLMEHLRRAEYDEMSSYVCLRTPKGTVWG